MPPDWPWAWGMSVRARWSSCAPASGNFYFMEVNARLQVEHPVSEFVTGQDIVQWQLRIANGERLDFAQADVELTGHSIEARCYAEEPGTFQPVAGHGYRSAPASHGTACSRRSRLGGWRRVPPYYDPLIAKVISWDKDRQGAITELTRALRQVQVEGIASTVPVNLLILESEEYLAGRLHTGLLDELFAREVNWETYESRPCSTEP